MHDLAEHVLPALNAGLNATSALLAFIGWRLVLARRLEAHARFMVAATCASGLFLVSYVVRMILTGAHRFQGPEWLRACYLVILFTHMTLAVAIVPMIIRVIWLGTKDRLDDHRVLARITLPLWLYVSITGVVIYVMVYHVSR
jgi:uncharacterized membrane protein YozB (DUF420 family)